MGELAGSIAANIVSPCTIIVPVKQGKVSIIVSPWTMAQQDQCFPLLVGLIDAWSENQRAGKDGSIGLLIVRFKDDVKNVCEITTHAELQRVGLTWNELDGEDLFVIAQAIWDTSMVRPGGGGVLGKLIALLVPISAALISLAQLTNSASTPTPPPTEATAQSGAIKQTPLE